MGLPSDELDDSVPDLEDRLAGLTARTGSRMPREMRVLFRPRDEVGPAHRLWPQLVEHADVDCIIAEREPTAA